MRFGGLGVAISAHSLDVSDAARVWGLGWRPHLGTEPTSVWPQFMRPTFDATDVKGHPYPASTVAGGKGVAMSDKSPRKTSTKKSGKSLKEKRQDFNRM